MKKILYAASRISHINNFHLPYIKYYLDKGFKVDVIAQGNQVKEKNVKVYDIDFEKKIISLKNIKTFFQITKILEKEQYDYIITNTTLSSFIIRIARKFLKNDKTKLINICHGYLFSSDTNFIKKSLYILAEKMCKNQTDLLLTMNGEDYNNAVKYQLSNGDIYNIKGMGIQRPKSYDINDKIEVRKKYNLKEEDIIITYAAEHSKRKNQIFLINSMKEVLKIIPNAKLLLAGNGKLYDYHKKEIHKKNLNEKILLLGYVKDIDRLIYSSDIVISSSKSEGLPFNIMEAMSLKTPVLASRVKGHKDLIEDGETGYLFEFSKNDLIKKLTTLIENKNIEKIVQNAHEYIENYCIDRVMPENIAIIYNYFNK